MGEYIFPSGTGALANGLFSFFGGSGLGRFFSLDPPLDLAARLAHEARSPFDLAGFLGRAEGGEGFRPCFGVFWTVVSIGDAGGSF